jgi:hypothetical protein
MKQSTQAVLAGAVMMAASCATPVAPSPDNLPGEAIVYETSPGPWCGRCDTLKITAAADGRIWVERGWWAGNYKNWRKKHEALTVTPERLAAFKALLDQHRPRGALWLREPGPNCEVFWSDSEERIVSWWGPKGEDKLWYNFGCDPETKAALRNDLKAAPEALGIANTEYVGVATTRLR